MSICGVALVPAAPVLIPELTGSSSVADEPRRHAHNVIRQLIETGPNQIIVVSEGDSDAEFDESSSWGLHRIRGASSIAHGSTNSLPISLAIGASLLHESGWKGSVLYRALDRSMPTAQATEWAETLSHSMDDVGILLLGNGSARSTMKAPGSLHPNAEEFNDGLISVVKTRDRDAMMSLLEVHAEEQMSDIRLPLAVLAGAFPSSDLNTKYVASNEFMGVFYVFAFHTGLLAASNE